MIFIILFHGSSGIHGEMMLECLKRLSEPIQQNIHVPHHSKGDIRGIWNNLKCQIRRIDTQTILF